MNATCSKLRRKLTESGAAALRGDVAGQEHVAGCEACFTFLEALARIEQALPELPPIEAPDEVVASLLERAEIRQPVARGTLAAGWLASTGEHLKGALAWTLGGRPRFALVAVPAAMLVMASLLLLVRQDYRSEGGVRPELPSLGVAVGSYQVDYDGLPAAAATPVATPAVPQLELPPSRVATDTPAQGQPAPTPNPVAMPAPARGALAVGAGREALVPVEAFKALGYTVDVRAHEDVVQPEKSQISTALTSELDHDTPVLGRSYQDLVVLGPAATGKHESESKKPGKITQQYFFDGGDTTDTARGTFGSDFNQDVDPRTPAGAFLTERDRIGGLTFRSPLGYWANTYVPGDRDLRRLESELRGAVGPHDDARRVEQPFDAPDDAALALYLHSDRAVVSGPSRVLLQVGLRGTERHGQARAAMNLALVLDLRSVPSTDQAAAMRALALALAAARTAGDRFALVVAGRAGALVVPPSDFRNGPLAVALEPLFDPPTTGDGTTLDLRAAMSTAIELVCSGDDPEGPLGSSAVLLVTAQPLGLSLHPLLDIAERSSISGIPVSAVGVGSNVRVDELDRLTLAGQGNRRLLLDPAEASALVERELASVGRAVARALRLSIRLASGVELVDVIGSERLDDARTRQVKEAEESIDLRLARNLGIEQDRGRDEQGIQIVIPAFYAGDAHAILLDLVVPGPGAMAEVSVRYKDLVWLRNGVARAAADLPHGEAPRGPLEVNVLENLLAHDLGESLAHASARLAASDRAGAVKVLGQRRALLLGLPALLPRLAGDPGIATDRRMLDDYLALIGGDHPLPDSERARLAASLAYAARLKVLPVPRPAGSGPEEGMP